MVECLPQLDALRRVKDDEGWTDVMSDSRETEMSPQSVTLWRKGCLEETFILMTPNVWEGKIDPVVSKYLAHFWQEEARLLLQRLVAKLEQTKTQDQTTAVKYI